MVLITLTNWNILNVTTSLITGCLCPIVTRYVRYVWVTTMVFITLTYQLDYFKCTSLITVCLCPNVTRYVRYVRVTTMVFITLTYQLDYFKCDYFSDNWLPLPNCHEICKICMGDNNGVHHSYLPIGLF